MKVITLQLRTKSIKLLTNLTVYSHLTISVINGAQYSIIQKSNNVIFSPS